MSGSWGKDPDLSPSNVQPLTLGLRPKSDVEHSRRELETLFAFTERELPASNSVISLAAFPNPFLDATTLTYRLADAATVSIRIHDMLGRTVTTLINHAEQPIGEYSITWNSRDIGGTSMAGGVYIYRVDANGVGYFGALVLAR